VLEFLEILSLPLQRLWNVFFTPGGLFFISGLLSALTIAVIFLARKRITRGRRVRVRTIARALFPRWLLRSRSHATDVGYFFFAALIFSVIFGQAIVSFQLISNFTLSGMTAAFGAPTSTGMPEWVCRVVITIVLFLAYELGYWIDHYLMHRIPALWEFHKVHHSAEVLTPLTQFRLHPVDAVINGNILAVTIGLANGVANYAFGRTTVPFAITDTNLLFVFFVHAYLLLQHTHLWITFRGWAGKAFLSPAHHQIHHSTNPAHFNKNLGSTLAIFDWLFGTLHVPAKEGEKLTFGVEAEPGHDHHSLLGSLVDPFWRLILRLRGVVLPPEEPPMEPVATVPVAAQQPAQT
jgi:sterol desaturase/sphingolipid hydroxylase (fatty acid hydroxylase superfamily)